MLSAKSILITGGAGSFGQKLVATILAKYPEIKRTVIYSRDEHKQREMNQTYPADRYPQVGFVLGDVRDKESLRRAMAEIDVVIHAAALAHAPAAEENPFEFIKTNVLGAQNVIECAIENGVTRVIALSADHAAAPVSLYGATRLCADKLFVSANNIRAKRDIRFSVVRYGQIIGGRGSDITAFLKQREQGLLTIADRRMTRFGITLDQSINMVLYALPRMWGGEIFVPKIPSYRILDLTDAAAPGCRKTYIGLRPGEKLHEELITAADAYNTMEFDNYFVIMPPSPTWSVDGFMRRFDGRRCAEGFHYSSDENNTWLSIEQIRELIRTYVDPEFTVNGAPTGPDRTRLVLKKGTERLPERLPIVVKAEEQEPELVADRR